MKFYEISCLFPYQTGIGTRVVLWTFVVPTYLNLRFETRTWNLSWDFLDLHFDIGFRIECIVTGRPDLILSWLTWLLGPETWHQIEDWTRLDLDVSWLTWGLTWLVQVLIDLRPGLTFMSDQTLDLDLLSRTWNSTLKLNCLIWLELVLNLTSRTWKSPKETFHCWLETRLNCFVDKTLDFDLELPSKTLGLNWYFMQQ